MENLVRKKKVMQVAVDNILQTHNISKSDIIYIGDEVDDYKACQDSRIDFIGGVWGNDELKHKCGIVIPTRQEKSLTQ